MTFVMATSRAGEGSGRATPRRVSSGGGAGPTQVRFGVTRSLPYSQRSGRPWGGPRRGTIRGGGRRRSPADGHVRLDGSAGAVKVTACMLHVEPDRVELVAGSLRQAVAGG